MKIQSGIVESSSKKDPNWKLHVGSGTRTFDMQIEFDKKDKTNEFTITPKTFTSLRGIKVTRGMETNFNIFVKKIDASSAVITISADDGCYIESIGVSWFAYTN